MLNRIAAYSLFILGLLTMTFFRHYTGEIIPYPWVFFLAGIIMLVVGYLLLRNSPSAKDTIARKELKKLIVDLKENGEKIIVDLTNCEIRGNEYIETKQVYNEHAKVADLVTPLPVMALMYILDNSDNRRTVNVQQSVFICPLDNPRTGNTERLLSPVIPKDKVSLSFYLENQKQTTLYVDKADRSRYYFDLDFLFEGQA